MKARRTTPESRPAEAKKNPGQFKPGQSGNPGGRSKDRDQLRRALENDAERIHEALMKLVDEGNPQAIIYAHQQVFGKPKQLVEIDDGGTSSVLDRFLDLPDEQREQFAEQLERAAR